MGAILLAVESGEEHAIRRASRLRRDRQLAIQHSSHLDHLITVNGFFTALLGEARASQSRAELRRWRNESQSAQWVADHLSLDFGYAGWQASLVRPDGMGTWRENGHTVRFLVEIDTGTEPLKRLREKFTRYAALAQDTGAAMPWLLFSFPGPKRETHVRAALRRHSEARTVPLATIPPRPGRHPCRADLASPDRQRGPATPRPAGLSPPSHRYTNGGSVSSPTLDDLNTLPPTLDLMTAARMLGIDRTKAYELARDGEFPCHIIRIGELYRVSTADLLRVLRATTGER